MIDEAFSLEDMCAVYMYAVLGLVTEEVVAAGMSDMTRRPSCYGYIDIDIDMSMYMYRLNGSL